MITDKKAYRLAAVVLMIIAAFLLVQTAAVFANSENTDTDEDREDGQYTFTGEGDTYGYTSYLYNDGTDHHVSARYYYVTLPEDGKLDIELNGEQGVYHYIEVDPYQSETSADDLEWIMDNQEKALEFKTTTGPMHKGTYVVTFGYDLNIYLGPLQAWPGKHYIYHNLTFHTLNNDEKEALKVSDLIDALPDSISDIDREVLTSVQNAYNALTEAQKNIVGSYNLSKLNDAVKYFEEKDKQNSEDGASSDGTSNVDPIPGGSSDAEPSWSEDDRMEQYIMLSAAKKKTFKASKLRKAKKIFRAINVYGAEGKVTYKVSGNTKSKKALKFNKKNGKITVRKGTKKGKYALTITVKASGNSLYYSASRKVKITVKVK